MDVLSKGLTREKSLTWDMRWTVSITERRSTSLSCSCGNEAVGNIMAQGRMKGKEKSLT